MNRLEAARQAYKASEARLRQPMTGWRSELDRVGAVLAAPGRIIESAVAGRPVAEAGEALGEELRRVGAPRPVAAAASFLAPALTDPLVWATAGASRVAQAGRLPKFSKRAAATRPAAGSASSAGPSPAEKIIEAVKAAKPLRAEQEAAYSVERGRRIGRAAKVWQDTGGEAGFKRSLGALKGELPKVQAESIRPQVTQADVDTLFNQLQKSTLRDFEKVDAGKALLRVLDPRGLGVPQPKQLELLSRVYGEEFVAAVTSNAGRLWKRQVAEVINVPRALMASFDLSAPLRQGIIMLPAYPRQFFRSFVQMFRYAGSEKAYRGLLDEIATRTSFSRMNESGLALTGLNDLGPLTAREEAFIGANLAEKIPGVGKIIRASDRAYTGFLTKLRADVFDDLLRQAERSGVKVTEKVAQDAARFINAATGRGSLGALEAHTGALTTALFSPRLIASRVQMLNPFFYKSLAPAVRKQAVRSMLSFVGAGLGVLGLLSRVPGVQVGANPRSADFGKIRIGKTRIDLWGGLQPYAVVIGRLLTGEFTSSTTGQTRPEAPSTTLTRFGKSKLAPVPGLAVALADQPTWGKRLSIFPEEVAQRVSPMFVQDVWDAAREEGWLRAAAVAPAVFFGLGSQTYDERPQQRRRQRWP